MDAEQFSISFENAKNILQSARKTKINIFHSGLSLTNQYKELGEARYGLRVAIPAHQTFIENRCMLKRNFAKNMILKNIAVSILEKWVNCSNQNKCNLYDRARYAAEFVDNMPMAFVAIYDHQPIGMACLRVTDGIREGVNPWLGSLEVHPNFRGRKDRSKF